MTHRKSSSAADPARTRRHAVRRLFIHNGPLGEAREAESFPATGMLPLDHLQVNRRLTFERERSRIDGDTEA
jgi:hypothetical protein